MEAIIDLLQSTNTNFNLTIQKSDLIDFANLLISRTKSELEADITAQKAESFLTRAETCEFLKVDQSTLFRWMKREYLMPVEVGGKRLYKLSDLKRMLNGRAD